MPDMGSWRSPYLANKVYHKRGQKSIPDSNAKRRWDAENTSKETVKRNHRTDADIIAHLVTIDNKAAYLRSLIRRDITTPVDK